MKEPVERPLAKLTPAFWELGCYKKTAIARNFTIKCMKDGDTRAVAFRYSDNKYLEEQNNREAIDKLVLGIIFTFSVFAVTSYNLNKALETRKNNGLTEQQALNQPAKYGFLFCYCAGFLGGFLCASLGALDKFNAQLCKETKEGCAKWLNEAVGPDFIKELSKQTDKDEASFFKANQFLDEKKISKAYEENIIMTL